MEKGGTNAWLLCQSKNTSQALATMVHQALRGLRTPCSSSMTMKRSSPPLKNCSAGAIRCSALATSQTRWPSYAEGQIAVVMADQRMPGVSGSELLAHVALLEPDVTRILMTAYADLDAVMQAINQGKIYYYVSKPWESNELEAIIDKAVEYHDSVT